MQKIGRYQRRETYYLELKEGYENHLPNGNWICFAIANEKPEEVNWKNSFENQSRMTYLHLKDKENLESISTIVLTKKWFTWK